MPSAVLEAPVLTLPALTELPCEERKVSAPPQPENWISYQMLRVYISSYNFLLSELGWVPQSILEVGCGDGRLLSYLTQSCMVDTVVTGVDYDANKIALAQEVNCCRIEFKALLEGESLPFADNSVDLVISHGYLGESKTPRSVLQEMARVSAEAVIVSAPSPLAYQFLKHIPGTHKAALVGNPVFGRNIQPIAMNTMTHWLERCGLKVESKLMPAPYGLFLARKPQK